MLHQQGATAIDGATYTVDQVGNRLSKQDHLAGLTEAYSYDPIYQLTQAVQGSTPTETYTYDKVGNRTGQYAVNNSNQLTLGAGSTFTYDNNGNTLTKTDATTSTGYSWDFEDRLTQAALPGGLTVSFKYDPFGRRIYKSTATATTVYLYDGANIVEERHASGAALARYTHSLGVDEPLAMLRGANSSVRGVGIPRFVFPFAHAHSE